MCCLSTDTQRARDFGCHRYTYAVRILFCLPPHTTHALQLVDIAVFKSLKDHFSKSVHALSFSKPNFVVSKCDFACVFKVPFECPLSIPNNKAGFAKARISPPNADVVPEAKTMPSALYAIPSPSSPSSTSSQPSTTTASGARQQVELDPPCLLPLHCRH